jgi:hypothetical protein
MNKLIEWINSSLSPIEPVQASVKLNGLYKCVSVKSAEELQVQSGLSPKMAITGCEETQIYIDSSVESVQITSCINCTIFIAAVQKVCTIEKCENVIVCVAAQVLRIGNCVDSIIYSYTPSFPPIVYGDTRNLRMGPHNADYNNLADYLKQAEIKFERPVSEKD